jgi:hypothetical protein
VKSREKREQGREDLSATKKDKTQENACQQKQRDIIKIQRIQTCRKEQFEKDKMNGEKKKREKREESKTVRLVYSISRQGGNHSLHQ